MSDDAEYNEQKDRVVQYLSALGGKGADTTINIGKNTDMKRKAAAKVLARMEQEGLVQSAGVTAGVAGYKLVK